MFSVASHAGDNRTEQYGIQYSGSKWSVGYNTTSRLRVACDACAARKIKCSKEHPQCERCVADSKICVYSPSRKHNTPQRKRKQQQNSGEFVQNLEFSRPPSFQQRDSRPPALDTYSYPDPAFCELLRGVGHGTLKDGGMFDLEPTWLIPVDKGQTKGSSDYIQEWVEQGPGRIFVLPDVQCPSQESSRSFESDSGYGTFSSSSTIDVDDVTNLEKGSLASAHKDPHIEDLRVDQCLVGINSSQFIRTLREQKPLTTDHTRHIITGRSRRQESPEDEDNESTFFGIACDDSQFTVPPNEFPSQLCGENSDAKEPAELGSSTKASPDEEISFRWSSQSSSGEDTLSSLEKWIWAPRTDPNALPKAVLFVFRLLRDTLLSRIDAFSGRFPSDIRSHAAGGVDGTHNNNPLASFISSEYSISTETSNPSSAKRKSRRSKEDDGEENEDDGEHPAKKPKTTPGDRIVGERTLACPFYKYDPDRYRNCFYKILREPWRVKYHLQRYHKAPIHCPRCFETFRSALDRNNHIRTCTNIITPKIMLDGVDEDQKKALDEPLPSNISKEDCWYRIWGILFPHVTPVPISPYTEMSVNDFCTSIAAFNAKEGISIADECIATEWATSRISFDTESRSIVAQMFSSFADILLHRWQNAQTGNQTLPMSERMTMQSGGTDFVQRSSREALNPTSQTHPSISPTLASPLFIDQRTELAITDCVRSNEKKASEGLAEDFFNNLSFQELCDCQGVMQDEQFTPVDPYLARIQPNGEVKEASVVQDPRTGEAEIDNGYFQTHLINGNQRHDGEKQYNPDLDWHFPYDVSSGQDHHSHLYGVNNYGSGELQ